ncbi:ferrous iron transport protein A [Idiomarina tyrosinivorans]|uniref:Ferrous iron transport protein A n=1 Tax=Idiomarina tyrosinivorans TaxID=1445662 RepID=A0A432ZQ71_9GAMM|nr:FeoA family protein [Idiomarina tyrosinivorans]RUO79976.1 ferrous iron transport protein A [Idiomarina tyrosinivorans]
MTLWDLQANQIAHVQNFHNALSTTVANRLEEMGFCQGQPIVCLRRSPLKGPLVVQLGDCVYSLEQTIAEQIHLTAA